MTAKWFHRGYFTAIILAFVLIQQRVTAQYSSTMFFMKNVPQSHLLNPAYQPGCNFYLGFPGLAPIQVSVENDAVSIHDIVFYDSKLDSTIFFFHPSANKDKFLANFGPRNYISGGFSAGLVSMGFRAGSMFFSFDVSQKVLTRIRYPKDLVYIPIYFSLDEDGDPRNFDLSNFAVNATAYTEFAMGASRKFLDDQLSIGVRGKLLLGEANIRTTNADIHVNTGFEDNWEIVSKFEADASIPFATIPRDSAGKFDFGNLEFRDNLKKSDIRNVFLSKPNLGLAMDLGIVYQPVSRLTLSMSVLDLGYLRWRKNKYNVVQNVRYTFKGIEMTKFITGEDTSNFGDALRDTLKNTFTFTSLENKYTTILPTHIMAGASYSLTKWFSLGAMGHFEIFEKQMQTEVTLSANLSAGRFFATSFSYSLLHNEYNEIGLGFAFKPGPFQFYMVFDHIPLEYDKEKNTNLPFPSYAKGFSIRAGMNLVFGCNHKKKINKDIPLVD